MATPVVEGGNSIIKPVSFPMGTVLSSSLSTQFLLEESVLYHHACVLGATGSGKSKFLELLMRYLTVYGQGGYALIDPHGDLSEDILAFLRFQMVVRGRRELLKRFHYLEPSYEQVFHYDPFKFPSMDGISKEKRDNAIRQWIHTKADRIGEIVQRKQGDTSFEGMARLQRVLTNLLIAVATPVDNHGHHLPLSDALVLLNRHHSRYEDVYFRVLPHLHPDQKSFFQRLHNTKSQQQYMNETESTLNRLSSFLSPLVKSIFAEQTNTIDFESIIQNGEILLVNLRQTNMFSADQASAIGGMFIHELLSTAQNTPRQKRKQFHLIIDEAADFIGGDIQHALGVMRKFKMSMIFGAQDLSSLKKGDLDLRPKVLSQCGTKIIFRQDWPEDLDILAKVMGMGNLNFEKHFQVMDRPDGYEFMPMTEYSENFTSGENWTNGFSVTKSSSTSHTDTQTTSEQESTSFGRTKSEGFSEGVSESETATESSGYSEGETERKGRLQNTSTTKTRGGSSADSRGKTHGWTQNQGTSKSESSGHGWSQGVSDAIARTAGSSESEGKGGSEGYGITVAQKMIHLAKHREEWHETPSLMNQVADQLWQMQANIACLGQAQCVVKLLGWTESVVTQVAFVPEHWIGDDKFAEIEKAKALITAQHSYFSIPQLDLEAQNRRLDAYVTEAESGNQQSSSEKADQDDSISKATEKQSGETPFTD